MVYDPSESNCWDRNVTFSVEIQTDDHIPEREKIVYSKIRVKRPLSNRPKNWFYDQLSLNAGQKYCRMLQGEHSAIFSTFIKLPFVIKIFVYF